MIRAFLTYLQYEKNRSSHTVLSYKTDILSFENYLREVSPETPVVAARTEHVRSWVVFLLKEKKEKPRSVNRKLSALRTFYNYLLRLHKISENPLHKISALKTEKSLPVFFRCESVEDALCDEREPKKNESGEAQKFLSLRDSLIIDVLYETGMRRNELVNLKTADVHLASRTMKVLGKGNKERIIPFGDNLQFAITEYLEEKRRLVGDTEFLFCRENGEKLYPMLVYRIVHGTMARHSSLHKCSPHVLRHTFATSLLNEGANINAVKELLGHANLAATQVYTHLTFEQLQKIYKQAHPRA